MKWKRDLHTQRHSSCFPLLLFTDWVLGCCQSESTLNCACLIMSNIAVYNRDTYAHVSSTSVSNVGMSLVMLKIKQHLRLEVALEVAIQKFFNKDYGKYWDLCLANSINVDENDLANSRNAAENDWTDWQFSVSQALLSMLSIKG